ncbi:MAG: hemolysin III family protein [Lactobacillus sp.]|nr:hemolysin III family protein [Lactobacillus sp.]
MTLLDNIFSAITHGIGFAAAIVGTVFLILKGINSGSNLKLTAYIIYGICLSLLYLFSTLFHSLIYTRAKRVFQIFDHSSIFLLIAGSYTPYSLIAIGGKKGWIIFGIVWAVAIFGILFYILQKKPHKVIELSMYIILGWMIVFSGPDLYQILGPLGFWTLVACGISYTVGALIYVLSIIPMNHSIWHCFVLLGSVLMYISVITSVN